MMRLTLPALLLLCVCSSLTAQPEVIDSTANDTIVDGGITRRRELVEARRILVFQVGLGGIYGVAPLGGGLDLRLSVPVMSVTGLRIMFDAWVRGRVVDDSDTNGVYTGLSLYASYHLLWYMGKSGGLYGYAGLTRGSDPLSRGESVLTYGPTIGVGTQIQLYGSAYFFIDLRQAFTLQPHTDLMFGLISGWP